MPSGYKLEEILLEFSDNALKRQLDNRLKSPTSHKLIDAAAVKYLGRTSKLNNGLMASGDFAATCAELAVYYAKKDKK